MQRQQRVAVLDLTGIEELHRLLAALDDDADVLALVGQAMDAACSARIDTAAEEIDGFGRAAWAGQEAMDRHRLADGEPGFLLGLPTRHRGRGLVLVDDAGDDLELPGGKTRKMRREAELLDEDESVARRVVEQDADRVMAKKHLAREFRAPAAGEETMSQTKMVDAEIAAIDRPALADGDRVVVQSLLLACRQKNGPCEHGPSLGRKRPRDCSMRRRRRRGLMLQCTIWDG